MEDLKKGIEWDGRVLKEEDDGSLTLSLNRQDILECAKTAWGWYSKQTVEADTFPEWLNKELLKLKEDKNEN